MIRVVYICATPPSQRIPGIHGMTQQNTILAAALRDAAVTRQVVVAAGALTQLPAIVRRCLGSGPVLVVADDVTYGVAGAAVTGHLVRAGLSCAEPMILSESP